jgi:subtilisin family serine protease
MPNTSEPLYARDISPVEPPVQRASPILTELPQADRLIRARPAREQFNVNGKGLVVAVLDTGLRTTHADFEGRVVAQRNFTTDNGGDPNNASDGQGHGTNVAGIICAGKDHIGIAPGAGVVPCKVLTNGGGGSFDAIRDALQWVIDNRQTFNISAVCMSLSDSRNHSSDGVFPGDAIQSRLRTLKSMGVVCCIAAGNDYFTHGSRQGMGYPGIFREAVSVGAVYDANEGAFSYNSGAVAHSTAEDRITPFSQRLHESVGGEVATDIFAPGAPITSSGIANDRAESIQHGTSQATPVVTGVVLLLQELYMRAHGQLPAVDDVTQWLRSSAVRIVDGDDENDNVQHTNLEFRRVDALAALEAAQRAIVTAAFFAGGSPAHA